jgi:hypothetical protein
MRSNYHIDDEPRPGPLARLAVRPFWPLLAVMLGGAWLSWPWFVINGLAVGSPTLKQEIRWVVAGLAGGAVMLVGLLVALGSEVLPPGSAPYAILVLTVWKLLVSYRLHQLQGRTFELYVHYGGTVRSGLLVVGLGLIAQQQGLLAITGSTFLELLLA